MTRTGTTYQTAVREFDHAHLAALPAYARLRQALSDLGDELGDAYGGMELAAWLAAVRDMGATASYPDMCGRCTADRLWWPHAATRKGDYIYGTYRCDQGHQWKCTYAAGLPDLLAGLRNGDWLNAQDFGGAIEAGELVRDGSCTAQCLVADEPGGEQRCSCRCGGRHHGALASVLVDA